MDRPTVSIVTPIYNSEQFITETLNSVINQTFQDWELILIDDASTDKSLQIAQTFQIDNRIKLLALTENNGTAHCRNLGTEISKGIYIAFLDADDLWHSKKLERQLQFMKEHRCNVSFTSYLQIDEDGNSLNKRIRAMPYLSYNKQLHNNYIGNLTGMYDVDILGKIIAPNIRKRQDWAVWLEAIKRSGKPAKGLQEDLAFYRLRKGSISSNKINLLKYNFQFYRKHLKYSWLLSFWHLLIFFIEYFFIRPKHIERIN